ncbi:hypothetical protein ACIPWI_27900 [Streptomyces sp. NPDC090046]|uniref:hypothetical protein n=1 Tax=Streptomyces sp. NPDC090046 TaxID=3365928 RepID=UPI003830B6A9
MIGLSSLRFYVFQAGAAQELGNISGGVRTPEVRVHAERLSALLTARRLGTLPSDGQAEITCVMQTLAGRTGPARLVLMAGLPGSGKTALAHELELRGFLRLCPDERVWRTHGHYGRDFPRGEYKVRGRPILEGIAAEPHLVHDGRSATVLSALSYDVRESAR